MLKELIHEAAIKLAHAADQIRTTEKKKEQKLFIKTTLLTLLAYFLNILTSKLQEAYDATGNYKYLAEAAISDLVKDTTVNSANEDFQQTIREEEYKDETIGFETICLFAAAATDSNLLTSFKQHQQESKPIAQPLQRKSKYTPKERPRRPVQENHRAGKISHAFKRGGPR